MEAYERALAKVKEAMYEDKMRRPSVEKPRRTHPADSSRSSKVGSKQSPQPIARALIAAARTWPLPCCYWRLAIIHMKGFHFCEGRTSVWFCIQRSMLAFDRHQALAACIEPLPLLSFLLWFCTWLTS